MFDHVPLWLCENITACCYMYCYFRKKRELTLRRCLRTLRAWRPPEPLETMHACRVFVLHNMHISLDFSSVDFQGMLEVLGLLLIFMHRGI